MNASPIESRTILRPAVEPGIAKGTAVIDADAVVARYEKAHVPVHEIYAGCKRAFDITVSLSLLILLSPLMILVAIAILLDSPGPAIYSQIRKGRYQIPFRIYKFRTMQKDSDALRGNLTAENEVDGIIFKIRNDCRITRIGKLLRKYSVDELPQLFNILKGEMSLIGPRPFPLEDFSGGKVSHPLFDRWLFMRHQVPPGLTGLWQVSGRNDLSFQKLMILDLAYVRRSSVLIDFGILWRTVGVVLTQKGAY